MLRFLNNDDGNAGYVLISAKGYTKEARRAFDKGWTNKQSYNHLMETYGNPYMIAENSDLYWKIPEKDIPVKDE